VHEVADLKRQMSELSGAQGCSGAAIPNFGAQLAQAKQEVERLRKVMGVKKFPFTADPPNKPGEGKMRPRGIIAHLTARLKRICVLIFISHWL
jgi:hypothetical protein